MAIHKQEEKQTYLEAMERELLKKKLELEQKEFDMQMWKDSTEKYAVVCILFYPILFIVLFKYI